MTTERYFAQLQDERKRYEAICEFLTPAEREHIESLRQARLRGEHAHYGHDLIGAIARGHRRRASELADALHEQCRLAATYGRPPATDQYAAAKNASHARVAFAGAVRASVKAAARAGVAPEEVRTWLLRVLDAEDATSIEHMMRPE